MTDPISFDYLIVGGGMAADAAARGIREVDQDGSIGILSADVDPPYTRPALTKKLWTDPDFTWDQVPLDTVAATDATLMLDTEVVGIEREAGEVVVAGGDHVGYRLLLLATGSTPNRLPSPDDPRIVHFRSARDYHRLRALSGDGRHAVVVGGGYIGAELAAALVQNDTRVTLVHPDALLGASQFPDDLARRYETLFVDGGVELISGRTATSADATDDGIQVTLDDGTVLDGDALVVGLGASPVVDIAEQAGLDVADGVVVNELLVSDDPRIWAAGDIARYPDAILGETRIEHVDNAEQMGTAAGRSMAGRQEPYRHTPYFYSAVFGARWEAIGRLDPTLETVEDRIDDDAVIVWYLEDDAPVGVVLWNVPDATDEARAALAGRPERGELVGRIRPAAPID